MQENCNGDNEIIWSHMEGACLTKMLNPYVKHNAYKMKVTLANHIDALFLVVMWPPTLEKYLYVIMCFMVVCLERGLE